MLYSILDVKKNLCIVRKNTAVCQVVSWGETMELSSPMQSYIQWTSKGYMEKSYEKEFDTVHVCIKLL